MTANANIRLLIGTSIVSLACNYAFQTRMILTNRVANRTVVVLGEWTSLSLLIKTPFLCNGDDGYTMCNPLVASIQTYIHVYIHI